MSPVRARLACRQRNCRQIILLSPGGEADQFTGMKTTVPVGARSLDHEERSVGLQGQVIWASTTKVPLRNLQGDIGRWAHPRYQ